MHINAILNFNKRVNTEMFYSLLFFLPTALPLAAMSEYNMQYNMSPSFTPLLLHLCVCVYP